MYTIENFNNTTKIMTFRLNNDKLIDVNLMNGYNITIAAKLPHVPEANFM